MCEISTGIELLLTELICSNGVLNTEPEQCAALLSSFVFDETVGSAEQLDIDCNLKRSNIQN
ncbi:hypothetical protein EDD18DRAFT_1158817 [Armillaria luteobubalina]|uniref:ATP-dependent RNA helicase Ski2/MTR4 C-terminal domain-containing protein n=1 Tax=Armillaria luteobubalina TaxID=153913 RepID=A0AA39Q7K7_9AGAR|nr:hypothetical protein EDD18DRAFT_1158817 [Armillaria luteobubalina]